MHLALLVDSVSQGPEQLEHIVQAIVASIASRLNPSLTSGLEDMQAMLALYSAIIYNIF